MPSKSRKPPEPISDKHLTASAIGRKRRATAIALILASLEKTGGMGVVAACRAAGIAEKTWYEWIKQDPTIGERVWAMRREGMEMLAGVGMAVALTPDPKCHADRKFMLTNLSRYLQSDPLAVEWKEQSAVAVEGQVDHRHQVALIDFLQEAAGVKRVEEKRVIEGSAR